LSAPGSAPNFSLRAASASGRVLYCWFEKTSGLSPLNHFHRPWVLDKHDHVSVLPASNTTAKGCDLRASDGLIRCVSIIGNPKNVFMGSKSLS
jgi:hypothetical protein